MRKLFTFTGAQSTGKTTLLKKVKTLYPYRFDYVDEVTRRIKRFGVPINNEAKNYNLTQSLIINDHLVNYTKVFEESDDTVRDLLLDRCIVDGYIYTKYFYKPLSAHNFSNLSANWSPDTLMYLIKDLCDL